MTTIKVSMGAEDYESPHDYGNAYVQGGHNGIVFSRSDPRGSYRTAFVEAFIDNSFVRGEGATLEEADDACWEKVLRTRSCTQHEFVPRTHTNGAGFCKHCGYFASKKFTGEDLGQLCAVCSVGCLEHRIYATGEWYCDDHYPLAEYENLYYDMMNRWDEHKFDSDAEGRRFDSRYRDLSDIVLQKTEPDPNVLAFFVDYM